MSDNDKIQLLELNQSIGDEELKAVLSSVSPEDLDPHPSDSIYAYVLDDLIPEKIEEVLSIQARRKLANRMRAMSSKLARMRKFKRMLMAPQSRLQYRARKAAIMALRARVAGDRGKKYAELSPSEKIQIDKQVVSRYGNNLKSFVKIASGRLLPMIRRKESDRLRTVRSSESQHRPIKEQISSEGERLHEAVRPSHPYYRGLGKSTQSARHAQFANQTRMSDDDPGAYKPAPGDDSKKTRLSKHTRKYHSMYSSMHEGRPSKHGNIDGDPQDNIVYQMRKVINLRGKHTVKFADGSTMNMHPDHAQHIISRYHAQLRPLDKHRFVKRLGASSANMKKELGDQFEFDSLPLKQSYLTSGKKSMREEIGYRDTGAMAVDPEFAPTSYVVPYNAMSSENDSKASDMAKDRNVGTLLRLGLSKPEDASKIQKWLKGEKGKAMSSAMRDKLMAVLDKLMASAATDPQFISRVRTKHLEKKEDVSAAVAQMRERDRKALADKHERERTNLGNRHDAQQDAAMHHQRTLAKSRAMRKTSVSEAADAGLQKKAEKSGIPVGILRQVYNRGMAAWKTGHRPGANQQQWAYARVNSFITKGKGTWGGADKDLAARVRKEDMDEALRHVRLKYTVGKPASSYKPLQPASRNPMDFKGVDWKAAADSVLSDMRKAREARLAKIKKPVSEGAGIGSDELRREYAAATPGQSSGELDVSRVSAAKPWEVDEQAEKSRDIGKSVRTWEQVRTTLSGKRGVVSEASIVETNKCQNCDDCGGIEEELERYQNIDEENIVYEGQAVKLGAVTKSNRPDKKRMVHVRNDKGNIVRVHFGDPNMEIKRDDPARRKNFRARHGCDNPGPKWKARYWSCRYWSKTPVSKM